MKRLFLVVGILFVAIAVAAMFFVPAAWLRMPLPDAKRVHVEIFSGATASGVADILQKDGVIDSAFGYRLYAHLDPEAQKAKAGEYDIQVGMSYRSIVRLLALGPTRNEMSVTVIEGWTTRDIANALKDDGVDVRPSDFLAERFASDYPFLKLPTGTTLEGYLYPDTYRVWKDQLPDGLLRKQLTEFMLKTVGFDQDAQSQGRPFRDVVTLASIIEKEVPHDADRPIVAGIFMNRLKIGMALQSDATLNYVTQAGRDRLTAADLQSDSPYNTYKYKGLPPGPISNPSLSALQAALHPAKTDYLYFLTDSTGKAYFAKTLEQHTVNRQKAFGK